MFSVLGRSIIIYKSRDAVRSLQSRKMANWIKPKFENGDAEPHELLRQAKQYVYKKFELVFGLGLAIALYGVGASLYFTDYYRKHEENCVYNLRTRQFGAYPYPQRLEE